MLGCLALSDPRHYGQSVIPAGCSVDTQGMLITSARQLSSEVRTLWFEEHVYCACTTTEYADVSATGTPAVVPEHWAGNI
jgi:hypothetical protein